MNEPKKALDYFNSPAGESLKSYFIKLGFSGVIDQAYGVICYAASFCITGWNIQ